MYTTLYLVRHGQTVFNTQGLIQGRCDSPLTPLGRDQARAAAAWLREHNVRFDAAFSSPILRACDTMELLWAGVYMRLRGLQERSFGTLEGTDVSDLPKPMADFPARFGGEAQAPLEDRLSAAMFAIMHGEAGGVPGRSDAPVEEGAVRPLAPGESATGNVLVVSHGAACKAFAHAWREGARAEIPSPFPNCEILVYGFDGERFTLLEAHDPAAALGGVGLAI